MLRDSLALYREHGLKDRVAGVLNGLGDLAELAGDSQRATALYEESLALWRELRGTPGIASALHKLGQVSRSTHDYGTARARLTESLALQQELGNKQGITEILAGLAATTAASGHPERAASLFAASSAMLEAIGVPLAPANQAARTRDMDATRERLGGPGWERAWASGAALSTQDAISLALIDDDPGGGHRREPEYRTRLEPAVAPGTPGEPADRRGIHRPEDLPGAGHQREDRGQPRRPHRDQAGPSSRTRIAVWAVSTAWARTVPTDPALSG